MWLGLSFCWLTVTGKNGKFSGNKKRAW